MLEFILCKCSLRYRISLHALFLFFFNLSLQMSIQLRSYPSPAFVAGLVDGPLANRLCSRFVFPVPIDRIRVCKSSSCGLRLQRLSRFLSNAHMHTPDIGCLWLRFQACQSVRPPRIPIYSCAGHTFFRESRKQRFLNTHQGDSTPTPSEIPNQGESPETNSLDYSVRTPDDDSILSSLLIGGGDGPPRPSSTFFNTFLNSTRTTGEYYGSEDLMPYNEDGEFWEGQVMGSTQFDQLFDRWDTYDANTINPEAYDFAIRAGFEVPRDFDWNATTSDNYAAPEGLFYGPYAAHRAELDYSYHVNYAHHRQVLQDEIVSWWLTSGVEAERPWIIFTAGAMGAGKSHMLRMMEAMGCEALGHMVKVDPDTIKYQLPEMSEYIRRNPGPRPSSRVILAGVATHKESGFLQELVVRELMERRNHLVVDGSLANADWYSDYFRQIRRRHPEYRIGIIHVVCDPDVVWSRVQHRCQQTGRCIAWGTVESSIKATPVAVNRLGHLADFVAVVNSSTEEMEELRAAGSYLFTRRGAVVRQSTLEGIQRLQRLLAS